MDRVETSRKWENYLAWFFAAVALCCAAYAIVVAMRVAHFPFELDYEEGNILNAGLRITDGLTPYPDPHGWPVIINPYGPVAYLVTAALVKCFGVSFFALRVESIFCGISTVVCILLLLRRTGAAWPVSAGFAALFLCNNSARNWIVSCRVDWIGLALALGGLTIFFCSRKAWLLAVAFFVGALFVKVSLLAAPAACGLYLITGRDWRQLWRCLAAGVILGGAAFALTQWWSGGHFAFAQFGTHPDAYRPMVYFVYLWRVARTFPFLAGLSLLAVVFDLKKKRAAPPVLYLLMSVVGAATIGKAGSNTNHLLELYAALCFCAGYGWLYASQWLRERKLAAASTIILAGTYLAMLIPFALYRIPLDPLDDPASCVKLYQFLKAHGNAVLTDNVGALLLTGKPVQVSNPYVYSQLVLHAGWSDKAVRDRIREKKFDVILLESYADKYKGPDARFTPGMIQEIEQNYHVAAEFQCLDAREAYVPN